MLTPVLNRARPAVVLAALCLSGLAAAAGAEAEWLALCGKCVNPTIFSKTGIGGANAVAEARMTRAEVAGWCENWQPGDKNCVKQQLAAEDLKKVYRASANCTAGSITPVDGQTYKLAGVWDNKDIGAGRSKWRDALGKIVLRDNASGGLGISQQWEILCPGAGKGAKASLAGPPAGTKPPGVVAKLAPTLQVDEFAVGQTVLAKYGSDWVRARVNRVQHSNGPKGPQTAYDISLDNGKRGIVPQRMLKAAP